MKELSATDASRRFSDVLDAVEHDGERFVVTRQGRVVARIEPATGSDGASVKELLRRTRLDRAWADELRELRGDLEVQERSWTD